MDPLSAAVAGGMRARLESLEMLANNIANAATAGYKSDREFYNLYVAPEAGGLAAASDPYASTLPVIESRWTDFGQGTLIPTGNPLHLAISGKGFFSANGPRGVLYTRNGNFRLSASGVLETLDGYSVRSVEGQPVQLDGTVPFEVAPDGTVRQNGQDVARLGLVEFGQPQGLSKVGHTYFEWVPGTAPATLPAESLVHQGQLESANGGAAESAVRLVHVMRQFEMLQRALALAGEMNRKAVDEVARVQG